MNHEVFMRRCLTLAQYGDGQTAPNPMVGAVIVCDGKIIGEGYHRRCGEPHAEINAINSVRDKNFLKRSSIYVTLEPCSHCGKTPPCTDAIIKHQIPRVVIGMLDINPKVNGNGLKTLLDNNIDVVVGVLEDECRRQNRRFLTFIGEKRPYVMLKWAQTSDGFIDKIRESHYEQPLKISNSITKTLNHQSRTLEDGVLIATKTALLDNPHLTARKWYGKNPVRMLIDRNLTIPKSYIFFDQSAKTFVFNNLKNYIDGNNEFIKIDFCRDIIPQILSELYSRNISSIIVEGGRRLLNSFIESNLWDECQIETSTQMLKNGVEAPILKNYILHKKTLFDMNDYSHYRNVSFNNY